MKIFNSYALTFVSLASFLAAIEASANFEDVCGTEFANMLKTTERAVSERAHSETQYADRRKVDHYLSDATHAAGRQTTAVQDASRQTAQLVREYLFFGDVGPLITRWKNLMRDVELSTLKHAWNTKALESMNFMDDIKAPGALTLEQKTALESWTKKFGFWEQGPQGLHPSKELEKVLASSDAGATLAWLNTKKATFTKQNIQLEREVGRNVVEYKIVREEIESLMDGKNEHVLREVQNLSDRPANHRGSPAVGAPPSPHLVAPHTPPAPLKLDEALDREIKNVDDWIREFSIGRKNPAELEQYLQDHPVNSTQMPKLLRLWNEKIAANQPLSEDVHESIVKELSNWRADMQNARKSYSAAEKFNKVVALNAEEQKTFAPILGPKARRPKLDQILALAEKPEATKARTGAETSAERHRNAVNIIADAIEIKGGPQAVAEGIKRKIPKLSLPGTKSPFKFFGVIDDLTGIGEKTYNAQVLSRYQHSLYVLRRFKDMDAGTLKSVLERLNAETSVKFGTRDKLLETLARQADMKETWIKVKLEAEKVKDLEPLPLYQRMLEAEKTAMVAGPLSLTADEDVGRRAMQHLTALGVATGAAGAAGVAWFSWDGKTQAKPTENTPEPLNSFQETLTRFRAGQATAEDVKKAAKELDATTAKTPLVEEEIK